ncbi:FAD-dependent 5-carboxymethylaminomethyl-2-thiouridine(34) oxidoreductase MnmC [Pseudomonas aeruginosa]
MSAPWETLLDWWFGTSSDAAEVVAQRNGLWFGKNVCQDADAGGRFGDLVNQALDGGLQEWTAEADGWLALILLLDQLPRMIYRDTPRAYAGDARLGRAQLAIRATAADISDFPPAAELPLKRIRGQVTRLPATPQSRALRTVVCAEGYVAPPRGDEHTLGASFDFKSEDLAPTLAEHQGNLELLREISPDLLQRLGADDLPLERLEGRAAFRCTSPDYLPLVGPLAERTAFDEAYAVLARDARQVPERACPWLPGLYLNSGHGSRGLISAPLSGELLAAWICGEPLPLPRAVAEGCHPIRCLLRYLVRGQRG